MPEREEALPGHATAGVVRVGDTVRRPAGPWTDTVDALLLHLRDAGFDGAPRPLGRDNRGRQVLEFIPGEIGNPSPAYSPAELAAIGRLLRDLHRAVAGFVAPTPAVWNRIIPPDAEEIICHNDAAPWNLVRAPHGWALIDWDAAGPGTRLWELAYSAQSMALLTAGQDPWTAGRRMRALVDGYGLEEAPRHALAGLLGRRARAMFDLLRTGAREGRQPWARIWTEDGPYWRRTAGYLDTHLDVWRAVLLE